MAVDSANKRFSMMNLGSQPIFPLFPPGTSGVEASERYHLLTLYSGIALGAETAPVFSGSLGDQFFTKGEDSKAIDYSGYFSNTPTSYSISPAVEADWTFNTTTGVLTIDPTGDGMFGPYTITAANGGGSDSANAFFVTVNISAGGGYARGIKPLSYYEDKVKQLLEEEKEKLNEKLESEKSALKEAEIELKADEEERKQAELVDDEIRILLIKGRIQAIMDELARITLNNLEIRRKAEILQDDEDVINLLIMKGWL